jgi:hypothetical protein
MAIEWLVGWLRKDLLTKRRIAARGMNALIYLLMIERNTRRFSLTSDWIGRKHTTPYHVPVRLTDE